MCGARLRGMIESIPVMSGQRAGLAADSQDDDSDGFRLAVSL